MQNATKNSSLQMASLEQQKADINVMKLAEDQKVCIAFLLVLLMIKSVLVRFRVAWYLC